MPNPDYINRPEMEQFEKRVGEGFEHVSDSLDGIQETLTTLTKSLVENKITLTKLVTTIEGQEQLILKVDEAEKRCTAMEGEIESLKEQVTSIIKAREEFEKDKKDNARWKKRIGVTFILGIASTAIGLLLKTLEVFS